MAIRPPDIDRFSINATKHSRRWFLKTASVTLFAVMLETIAPHNLFKYRVNAQETFPGPYLFKPIRLSNRDVEVLTASYPEFADQTDMLEVSFAIEVNTSGEATLVNPIEFPLNSTIQKDIVQQLSYVSPKMDSSDLVGQNQAPSLVLTVNKRSDGTVLAITFFRVMQETTPPELQAAFRFLEEGRLREIQIEAEEEAQMLFVDSLIVNAFDSVGIEIEDEVYILSGITQTIIDSTSTMIIHTYADETGNQVRFVKASDEHLYDDNLRILAVVLDQPLQITLAAEAESIVAPTELMGRPVVSYQATQVNNHLIGFASTIPGLELGTIDQDQLAEYFSPNYLNRLPETPFRVEFHSYDFWEQDRDMLGGPARVGAYIFEGRFVYIEPTTPNGFREDDDTEVIRFYIIIEGLNKSSPVWGRDETINSLWYLCNTGALAAIYLRMRNRKFLTNVSDWGDVWRNELKTEFARFLPISYDGQPLD